MNEVGRDAAKRHIPKSASTDARSVGGDWSVRCDALFRSFSSKIDRGSPKPRAKAAPVLHVRFPARVVGRGRDQQEKPGFVRELGRGSSRGELAERGGFEPPVAL